MAWFWGTWVLCGIGVFLAMREASHMATRAAVLWCAALPWAFVGAAGALATCVLLLVKI